MDEAQRRALEETLLGGPRRYTRVEVAEKSGLPLDVGRRLWRAMGFADVGDDERMFTDADVEALRLVEALWNADLVDERTELAMTRAVGQAVGPLAEWEVAAHMQLLARLEVLEADEAVTVTEELLPVMEKVLVYAWRRHLAAAAGRALAVSTEELTKRTMVVGFADLVGYTSLTREISDTELGDLIGGFEEVAADAITTHHGRLVKTVGDEVMFVADDPGEAAALALQLADSVPSRELPPVRVGLARGPVVTRLGDVYGVPVNLASRLTSLAKPGTVLVDLEMAASLDDDERFFLKRLKRVSVRGYDHLAPSVLRRAERG